MVSVSCVVIAYNEAPNIVNALESILSQEGPGFSEVVVVDDCSADTTAELVLRVSRRDSRVRLVKLPENRGRGEARAAGIEAASGSLIAMVDADIRLPPNWLMRCMRAIKGESAAAVGGVAVPDGDATYICRRFGLRPRARQGSIPVTGNNGLYLSDALDFVGIDVGLRNGEDVALNRSLVAAGYRLHTVPGLKVEHHESKTFAQSVSWLFESGAGASRQLLRDRVVRLPDVVTLGFVGACLLATRLARRSGRGEVFVGLIGGYVYVVGVGHLVTRFDIGLADVSRVAQATVPSSILMAAYLAGRLRGAFESSSRHLLPSRDGSGRRRPNA